MIPEPGLSSTVARITPTNAKTSGRPELLAILACLLAFGLRVVGTDGLHFWGDSAYSVYAAHRDLVTIATERTTDGHPPLYYYLLHFWMAAAGDAETPVRFLSLLPGVLTVALTYRLGVLTVGPGAGALASLLAALSPYLVSYSRLPRMYMLLACCGVLATVLLLELARRPSLRGTGLYSLAVLAGAFSHYYGVLIPVAHGAALPALGKGGWGLALRWFVGSAVAGLLTLPWVLFAFLSSAQTTGGIISNAPWPPTIPALVEQLWLVAWTGEMVPLDRARLLTWGPTLALGVALLALASRGWRQHRGRLAGLPTVRAAAWLLLVVAVPVLISLPVFLGYPYFVRPRFFIALIPLLLVLAAGAIAGLARINRPGAVLLTSALILSAIVSLRDTYYVERNILEPDALELTQYLREHSTPGDGVILHAFWHQGYFGSRLGKGSPAFYPLRELSIDQLNGLFQRHRRLWLVMYAVEPRHPEYPLEEWLDRNAYRARAVWLGTSRLLLYTRPAEGDPQPVDADFDGQIALAGATIGQRQVRPGDLLEVGLHWRALARPRASYTTFVQLLDGQGRRRAGEDAEPLQGLAHTADWTPGTAVIQRQGLPVPRSLPAGTYTLVTGLYRQDTGQRLPLRRPAGADGPGDFVVLGTVTVQPPVTPPVPTHSSSVGFRLEGETITLRGYDGPQDRWAPGRREDVETATGSVTLTFPRPLFSPDNDAPVTLYWQADAPLAHGLSMALRLVAPDGRTVLAQEGPSQGGLYPTDGWSPGETVLDEWLLRPAAPLAPGTYALQVGVYREEAGGRRAWAAPSGRPAKDGYATVDRIEVRSSP